ncbi:MAG: TIGR01777 family oxidoreductase [Phaeodactylibacter sp.]|nr:TIGR01777 family oxidoreductase [Phaeodactylibacter sp.]
MATILIAGGTGLIGTRLSTLLTAAGHQVRHLSRTPDSKTNYPTFRWDTREGYIDPAALEGLDYLINLAGAGIADKRWTEARKQVIIDSRVDTNRLIRDYIHAGQLKVKAYISAAAIGYYGDRGEELVQEDQLPGAGFLAESTQQWEAAIREVEATGLRTVAIRIGLVLSTQGGALQQLLLPLKLRFSTYFGSGQQWYSWIHIDDLARLFIWAMEREEAAGIYNGVAPNPVRNKEMMQTLAAVEPGPVITVPVPAFLLRIALGEMADAVLISTRVAAEKVEKAGFQFEYPDLKGALEDLFKRKI